MKKNREAMKGPGKPVKPDDVNKKKKVASKPASMFEQLLADMVWMS